MENRTKVHFPARAGTMPAPRHARLFELLRQADMAAQARARIAAKRRLSQGPAQILSPDALAATLRGQAA